MSTHEMQTNVVSLRDADILSTCIAEHVLFFFYTDETGENEQDARKSGDTVHQTLGSKMQANFRCVFEKVFRGHHSCFFHWCLNCEIDVANFAS